jgi:hypothetical protein
MAQPGGGEIECRLPIRERADDGSPPDLAQNALERIVGSDALLVLLRKVVMGQRAPNQTLPHRATIDGTSI